MNSLYRIRGVIPFLIAVFLNTVVDLGHKIVIQNTLFKTYDGNEQVYLSAIVNALILLPFILMFSLAGFASDKYAKDHIMKVSAWCAVVLSAGITLCYSMGWFWAAFGMTFLLATQSAFYSPAKYSYIKLLFGQQGLATGNGWTQAVSIIGILSGTLLFSILFESFYPGDASSKGEIISTLTAVGYILILTSLLELVMVYRLPRFEPYKNSHQLKLSKYLQGKMTKSHLQPAIGHRYILLAIIGLSVFWSIGQVMLAAFPAFAKAQTGETNTIIIQATMAASGLGIAIGSMIAAKFSKNYIETGLIPLGALGVTLGLFVLPHLDSYLLMSLNFLLIGTMAGLFIVPLNSLIQFYAQDAQRGRIMAANNFIQNIAMLSFLGLTVVFSILGVESRYLLLFIAVIALLGFSYTLYKLPQSLVRFIFSCIFKSRYKVGVTGMKNIPATGGVLLLGNHISWIDWAIIQIASPRPVRFVMIKHIYQRWYLKWFFDLFGCVPIQAGASSQQSLQTISELLDQGEVVCLFPEGAISKNGQLSEFKRGFEKAAEKTQTSFVILPFYIQGLWGSQFSLSPSQKPLSNISSRRELHISFGEALDKTSRAQAVKQKVYELSIIGWKNYANSLATLPEAWIESVKSSNNPSFISDGQGKPISKVIALSSSILLSRHISKISPEQNIGLLLPTSLGGMITNMSVLMAGKTVVNINYTASKEAIASALIQAEVNTIYTSERFINKLEQRGISLTDLFKDCRVVYLEALMQEIPKYRIALAGTLIKLLPSSFIKKIFCKPSSTQATAAILFSSGSEGTPKGIELSHENIMANVKQISAVLDATDDDKVMASLPLFHAFGLTATQFMPLIEDISIVCHPDPTDSLGLAKAVAKHQATLLFGTSTFLRLYTRDNKVKPLMFDSLRLVIAGAEKLNASVRENFRLKFGKAIYEGYGATETSPVASVNLPDHMDSDTLRIQRANKLNTVGMPLPGTSFKIVDPETFIELAPNEDGMILIGGPQVMKGYLKNPEKNAEAIRDIDGSHWYVSGDKGHVDEDCFLIITDRYSRFAKIGGEMISLASVEEAIRKSIGQDDAALMAVNIPDSKKGESIILLSEITINKQALKQAMIACEYSPLFIPSDIFIIEQLPTLGSGKPDFATAKKLAQGL